MRDSATSLALEGAAQFTRADIAGAVIAALRRVTSRIAEPLSPAELEDFRALDALRDHWVEADGQEGKACGVAPSGALVLENKGTRTQIRSGPVRILPTRVSP